jgi:hypothetical protein
MGVHLLVERLEEVVDERERLRVAELLVDRGALADIGEENCPLFARLANERRSPGRTNRY